MSKKVEVASVLPAVVNKSELTLFQGVETGRQTRDNVMKVLLTRVSIGLDNKMMALKKELTDINARINSASDDLAARKKDFLADESNYPQELRTARAKLTAIISSLDPELTDKELREKVSLKANEADVTLSVGSDYRAMTFERKIVFSKDILERTHTVEKLISERRRINSDIQSVSVKQLELPKTRERIEAKIAETDLQSSEDGAKLMEVVGSNFGAFISDPELRAYVEGK